MVEISNKYYDSQLKQTNKTETWPMSQRQWNTKVRPSSQGDNSKILEAIPCMRKPGSSSEAPVARADIIQGMQS